MVGRYASLKTLIRFVPLLVVFGLMSRRFERDGVMMTAIAIECLLARASRFCSARRWRETICVTTSATWRAQDVAREGRDIAARRATGAHGLLTAIAWLLILSALMLSGQAPTEGPPQVEIVANRCPTPSRECWWPPPLILAQLVVQNGFAIAFPAWMSLDTRAPAASRSWASGMLMLAGNAIALALFVLPERSPEL
jgi:hypothetical protein